MDEAPDDRLRFDADPTKKHKTIDFLRRRRRRREMEQQAPDTSGTGLLEKIPDPDELQRIWDEEWDHALLMYVEGSLKIDASARRLDVYRLLFRER